MKIFLGILAFAMAAIAVGAHYFATRPTEAHRSIITGLKEELDRWREIAA